MKLRVRIRDTVEMIVTGNYKEFQKKYSMSRQNLQTFKQALRRGNWRIVEVCGK